MFYEVEQSSAGLKLYSFHSFHWLSFCIMYSASHVLKKVSVSDIGWLKHVLNNGCQWHKGHIPSAYGLKKHAYFSLFHNIYQSPAAKTTVPTFLYNSTLDWFQWAGRSISSVFRACSCLHPTQCCVCCDRHSLQACSKEGQQFSPGWRRVKSITNTTLPHADALKSH